MKRKRAGIPVLLACAAIAMMLQPVIRTGGDVREVGREGGFGPGGRGGQAGGGGAVAAGEAQRNVLPRRHDPDGQEKPGGHRAVQPPRPPPRPEQHRHPGGDEGRADLAGRHDRRGRALLQPGHAEPRGAHGDRERRRGRDGVLHPGRGREDRPDGLRREGAGLERGGRAPGHHRTVGGGRGGESPGVPGRGAPEGCGPVGALLSARHRFPSRGFEGRQQRSALLHRIAHRSR